MCSGNYSVRAPGSYILADRDTDPCESEKCKIFKSYDSRLQINEIIGVLDHESALQGYKGFTVNMFCKERTYMGLFHVRSHFLFCGNKICLMKAIMGLGQPG